LKGEHGQTIVWNRIGMDYDCEIGLL